ncbi:MAG: putative repeat protein (TIGR03806 family) [Granulosicoccus sp.]|jgi:uncharacterized repeat protein (TIGR03806 family)
MSVLKKIMFLLAIVLTLSQCKETEEPIIIPNEINVPTGDGFDLLSEYNFFLGEVADLQPNTEAGVLPYDLNTALFSDYASKKRFVYVPEGSSIPFDTSAVLELPEGSILIKHFYYPEPNGLDKFIETRLLIRKSNEWQPETYEWNDEQTDAKRTLIGRTKNLTVMTNGIQQSFNYLIPNQNQCKNCHAFEGKILPIGPTVQNLNRDYNYASGMDNQIDKWTANGILDNPTVSTLPRWYGVNDLAGSLEDRARAYLAVNCSSCHRLEGSASNSGFYLEYENTDSLSLGVWKTPVAAGAGSGGFTYVVHPGKGDESILLYRMIADEVDERMPEIGRELLHQEGIELIREWINSL